MDTTVLYNLRWQTPKGFAASLTIQSDDMDDLMSKAKTALEKLGAMNSNGNSVQSNPPGHFCQEHQTEFRRYEKEGRVWYAHKAGQKWCREKAA